MERGEMYSINSKPSFFRPLVPDFLTDFSIPKSFIKYLNNVHELETDHEKIAMLKDRREKTYWRVKIDYDDDHHHGLPFFKDGWDEFCKDHGLQIGDFLVFQHQGNLVFDVSIFDPSSCEREYFPSPLMLNSPSSVDTRRKGSPMHGKEGSRKNRGHEAYPPVQATFKPKENPYFQTLVKSYWRKSGMAIPWKFARENDLDKKSCKKIVVVDTKGKSWRLPLKHYKSIYIGGWNSFHVANSLEPHLPVVFELIHSTNNDPIFNFYKLS